MYTIERLATRHALADVPIEMPVDYLMALPPYVTKETDAPLFNLPLAMSNLLGKFGWERASRIVTPYVWAPQWAEGELEAFFLGSDSAAWFEGDAAPQLAIEEAFPGSEGGGDPATTEARHFEFVHFVGRIEQPAEGLPLLALESEGDQEEAMNARQLETALQAARSRLIIFQTGSQEALESAAALGRYLVERGGPAALAVRTRAVAPLQDFFRDLLAGPVHNRMFEEIERPYWQDHAELDFRLIIGAGSEELFSFDRYHQSVDERLRKMEEAIAEPRRQALLLGAERYLHAEQRERLPRTPHIETLEYGGAKDPKDYNVDEAVASIQDKLKTASEPWVHESSGAVPLTEAEEELQVLEATVSEVEREASRAPRVLNANFEDPREQAIVGPTTALEAGQTYDLLVDVGPRWDKIPSIVSGHSEFPEDALPPDESGYVIEVVVVSDDFSPVIASAEMWVPRGTGRSFPMENGEKAASAGPVRLSLHAPTFPDGSQEQVITANARLCLYYENNALQSAVVTAGVARQAGTELERPNSIEVDYVLSGGFQGVEEQFTTRDVGLGETGSVPVKVNLTMNDDGKGRHRFVVKGRLNGLAADPEAGACPPHAWIAYDPQSTDEDLTEARQQLLNCFFLKNEQSGEVLFDGNQPKYGLKQNNGKDRRQFKWDLFHLAQFGRVLWAKAFGQVVTDGACLPFRWQRNLRETLSNSSLIQVSRAGQTQYVFPWSLVYEYPLNTSEDWQFCRIVNEEWSEEGLRPSPQEERSVCKYHDKEWHAEQVICPYGFWGLKHVLEEPISLHSAQGARRLGNIESQVRVSGDLKLAVGLTRDASLNQQRIREHLEGLAGHGIRLAPAEPALDWDSAKEMLRAPEVVYFLCHGEYDAEKGDDYLSIGPRDDQKEHRIYNVTGLAQWAGSPASGPDFDAWETHTPLVFINGCHTADLQPGKVVSFATTFAGLGAGGILGTEISVDLPVATEFADSLFQKIASPETMPLGKAMRMVRWELVNKGNLLGLAYTLYGLASLELVRDSN